MKGFHYYFKNLSTYLYIIIHQNVANTLSQKLSTKPILCQGYIKLLNFSELILIEKYLEFFLKKNVTPKESSFAAPDNVPILKIKPAYIHKISTLKTIIKIWNTWKSAVGLKDSSK